MADKLGPLVLPIQVDNSLLIPGMQKAGDAVERASQRMGNALSSSSKGLSRFGQTTQQVGFQVGDFATQIASGGNAMVAFTQQSSQLLGFFGPFGAAAGAAVAVIGAVAIAMGAMGDEAKTAGELLDDASDAIANVRSSAVTGIEGLKAIREQYGALDAQLITLIQRQTQYNLLLSKTAAREAARGVASTKIDEFAAAGSAGGLGVLRMVPDDVRVSSGLADQFGIDTATALGINEGLKRLRSARDLTEQSRALEELALLADTSLNEGATPAFTEFGKQVNDAALTLREWGEAAREAEKAGKLLAKPIPELNTLIDAGGAGRGRRGANRGATDDLLAPIAERIAGLQAEQRAIGLSGAALGRYTRAVEAAKIERDLLAKAQERGRQISPDEAAAISDIASEYERVGNALDDARRAMDQQTEAAKKASAAQQELWGGISSAITQSISQAESFEDALRKVAIRLADIAVNALFGQGPGGAMFNQAIGSAGAGILGLLLSAKGNVFSGGRHVEAFANGGVIGGPTAFPMRGGVGLMGEAGPEAIMPLRRGPNGRLGVEVAGGGGSFVYQPQITVVSPNADPAQVAAVVDQRMRQALPAMQSQMAQRGIRS